MMVTEGRVGLGLETGIPQTLWSHHCQHGCLPLLSCRSLSAKRF